jgi:hypothetical protein
MLIQWQGETVGVFSLFAARFYFRCQLRVIHDRANQRPCRPMSVVTPIATMTPATKAPIKTKAEEGSRQHLRHSVPSKKASTMAIVLDRDHQGECAPVYDSMAYVEGLHGNRWASRMCGTTPCPHEGLRGGLPSRWSIMLPTGFGRIRRGDHQDPSGGHREAATLQSLAVNP